MRAWPQWGTHWTRAISASASLRRSMRALGEASSVRAMKYCLVARKITGCLHRQQCGYSCAPSPLASSAPAPSSSAVTRGFASKTWTPARAATSAV